MSEKPVMSHTTVTDITANYAPVSKLFEAGATRGTIVCGLICELVVRNDNEDVVRFWR